MKLEEMIAILRANPKKTFTAVGTQYTVFVNRDGGISIIRPEFKCLNRNLETTKTNMELDWVECSKPIAILDALKQTKKIRPKGTLTFYSADEWFLKIFDDRTLLDQQWEVEP